MATKQHSRRGRNKTKPDTGEISADASRDLFAAFLGDILENPDDVIKHESSGRGLKLYEEMERKDGHIKTVLQTRKLAVISKEWNVEAASDSAAGQRLADFVQQVFSELDFDLARLNQLDAVMKGFAVSEELWESSEGQWWIRRFASRRPWRFVWGKQGDLRMLTDAHPVFGEIVPREKFWVFVCDARYSNPYGEGLGQVLFWPYFFKKHNLKFWAVFNEKFGSPTAVGKYHSGASTKQKEALFDALKSIQQKTAVTIPEGMAIELLEAQRRGTFETYSGFIEWCDALESKIVLGQTLTTEQGDTGARSLGEVHERVRDDLIKFDADLLSESLNNGPVKRLIDFNFGPQKDYPKLWIKTSKDEDLNSRADRDRKLSQMGWRPSRQYIVDTYGVDVEAVSARPAFQPGNEFAEGDDEDTVDGFTERLMREAGMDPWIDLIRDALDESDSLEDFRQRLTVVFGEMKTDRMADAVEQALIAAELSGRFQQLPEEERE